MSDKTVTGFRSLVVYGLLVVMMCGCEKEPPPVVQPPASTTAPPEPESGVIEDLLPSPATRPAQPRTLKSLDLQLDDRSESPVPVFGAAPDSGWLEQGQETGLMESEEPGLLPDLFAPSTRDKPVDIKGRMLLDENTHDLSNPVDGAEISVEIKTGG